MPGMKLQAVVLLLADGKSFVRTNYLLHIRDGDRENAVRLTGNVCMYVFEAMEHDGFGFFGLQRCRFLSKYPRKIAISSKYVRFLGLKFVLYRQK